MYVRISVDGVHNASHLPLWHGGRQEPKVIDVGTQLHEILRLVHFFRESLWCSELRLNISPAEFSRVQPSSARFSRVQPSSAEFSQKPGFEFGRVRPSSKKFQVASRFVLGTRINEQTSSASALRDDKIVTTFLLKLSDLSGTKV